MIKPLNFGNFQAMKRYSYNQMNAWAVSVYKSGYEDGQEDGTETVILDFDEKTILKKHVFSFQLALTSVES